MAEETDGPLIVSNRAPFSVQRRGKQTKVVRTIGGMASTLDDLLREQKGTWLAWSGHTIRKGARARRNAFSLEAPGENGYPLVLLDLTEEQVAGFYHGFSNGTLWPLCHYFILRSRYSEKEWLSYEKVNRVFARMAARMLPEKGLAWVHDFQLALVPSMLRAERPDARIATFWHIPFPAAAVFRVNPRAREILEGMLGSDLIGFHTREYARHFLAACDTVCGCEVDFEKGEAYPEGRVVRVGAFPIGTEAKAFDALGRDPKTIRKAEQILGGIESEQLILGADRLDYTKGILERLESYELLLERHPELRGKVCFIQIQVPSRENVLEYRQLREQIDLKVGRISGRFSTAGWVPVRYLCRAFARADLAAYYRAADVMFVTPLRDGMNLVGQEYVATRADGDGVLVFSEFAGASRRLREAILVNPYDRAGMASSLHDALTMREPERRRAMSALRKRVFAEDVVAWRDKFMTAVNAVPALAKAAPKSKKARAKKRAPAKTAKPAPKSKRAKRS